MEQHCNIMGISFLPKTNVPYRKLQMPTYFPAARNTDFYGELFWRSNTTGKQIQFIHEIYLKDTFNNLIELF